MEFWGEYNRLLNDVCVATRGVTRLQMLLNGLNRLPMSFNDVCAKARKPGACITFEMGPWMPDRDATESRTVVDERDAHGFYTVGERARYTDGAREGGGGGLYDDRCMPAL